MMRALLLVGMGGALGSMARYLCQRWMAEYYPHAFPFGTFAVNLSGCLLIGLFWSLTLKGGGQLDTWKLFLMTGICGGFTTFPHSRSKALVFSAKTGWDFSFSMF